MKILGLKAHEILDSRGNPTVAVDLKTAKGGFHAEVPSGASTGSHEAVELRDGGKRYHGKGVLKAAANVHSIFPKAAGKDFVSQASFDSFLVKLDGTPNKRKLGANALLGCSMTFARAKARDESKQLYSYLNALVSAGAASSSGAGRRSAASLSRSLRPVASVSRSASLPFTRLSSSSRRLSLPCPCFNVINGGKHAGNDLAIQEFMLLPVGAKTFTDALRMGSECYHVLKTIIKEKYGKTAVNVGDEGGFAPPLSNSHAALDLLVSAIEIAGYPKDVVIGVDAAASEFYKNSLYHLDGKMLTSGELKDYYLALLAEYPIVSLEDPFREDDFSSFAALTAETKAQIVGDDLLCSNPARIKRAIKERACNALLLKVNQIGTVSEAIEAANLAFGAGWKVMVSHRSGETTDSFIADLAVGLGCGQIKAGAPCRGERLVKYNRLLEIEEELGKKAIYSPSFSIL